MFCGYRCCGRPSGRIRTLTKEITNLLTLCIRTGEAGRTRSRFAVVTS